MHKNNVIKWLLDGDPSIQYQTKRDLLGEDINQLQEKISNEGWGKKLLSKQGIDGHWGKGYYQPKWTSTHYTLLDLRNLSIPSGIPKIEKAIQLVLYSGKGPDGGINPSKNLKKSDVCINGMALNFCSYFRANQKALTSVIDFILSQQLPDGGFNCQYNRKGAVHSSMHSTISVLEGLQEYRVNGYNYHLPQIEKAEKAGRNFILTHRLFKSDHTGKVIKNSFLRFPYPPRWYYNILRAMDYFQYCRVKFLPEMQDAYDVLIKKRLPDGRWKVNAKYPGKEHFSMEKAGTASRWITLMALRIMKWKKDQS